MISQSPQVERMFEALKKFIFYVALVGILFYIGRLLPVQNITLFDFNVHEIEKKTLALESKLEVFKEVININHDFSRIDTILQEGIFVEPPVILEPTIGNQSENSFRSL